MLDSKKIDKIFNTILNKEGHISLTGFSDFDNILIDRPHILVLAPSPIVEKTNFNISILLNLLKSNNKCMYFSFNLSSELFFRRVISQLLNIPNNRLYDSNLLTKEDKENLLSSKNIIKNLNLSFIDKHLTPSELLNRVKTEKPSSVFIDSIQLIKTYETIPEKEMSKFFFDMKQIAEENNITFLITESIPYDLDDNKVFSSLNIPKFDILEEYSDLIVELLPSCNNSILLRIVRNKIGFCCDLNLNYDSSTGKFSNL